jgi:NADH:ubiquinone oxidoreductase subunit E
MATTVYVCTNNRGGYYASCGARGGVALLEALRGEAALRGCDVHLHPITCLGECARGPNMRIEGGRFWHQCHSFDAARLLDLILAETKAPPPEGDGAESARTADLLTSRS